MIQNIKFTKTIIQKIIIIVLIIIVGIMILLNFQFNNVKINFNSANNLSSNNISPKVGPAIIKNENTSIDENSSIDENLKNAQILYQNKLTQKKAIKIINEIVKKADELNFNNKKEESLETYEKVLNAGFININTVIKVYDLNFYLGNFEEALNTYFVLIKLSNYNKNYTGTPIEKNNLSKRIIQKYKELDKKEENKDNENLDLIYIELAKLHFEVADYYYNLSTEKNPYLIYYNNLLSLDLLNTAIKYNPNNPDLYYWKGRNLTDMGMFYDLAEIEFKKAIKLKTDDYRYYYRLGNTYRDQDKHELARDAFIKGIELNDKYEKLFLNLGNAYDELGDNIKSEQNYYKGTEVCEKKCSELYFNIGYELYYNDKYKEALPLIDKSISGNKILTKHDYKSIFYKGMTLYYLGKEKEAIKNLEIPMKYGYKIKESYEYLGLCYFNLGKYNKAKINLEKSLVLDPSNHFIKERLTDIKKIQHGDQVNLIKGRFIYRKNIITNDSKELSYEFNIGNKNTTYYNGPNGISWHHNYYDYLIEEENGNMLYYKDMTTYRFLKDGNNYKFNVGLPGTLENNGGIYKIEDTVDGLIYYFENNKSNINKKILIKIEDKNNNFLKLNYKNGLLSTVIDNKNRKTDYKYYEHNRMKQIDVYNGDKINFEYYSQNSGIGNSMDLKTITHTKGDNIIQKLTFEYTIKGSQFDKHSLTKIYNGEGNLYLTNTYINNKISSQDYGNGIINYTYKTKEDSIIRSTMLDEKGYKTIKKYALNGKTNENIYFGKNNEIIDYNKIEHNKDGFMTKLINFDGSVYKYSSDEKGNMVRTNKYWQDFNIDNYVTKDEFLDENKIEILGIHGLNKFMEKNTRLDPININISDFKIEFESSYFDKSNNLEHSYSGYNKIAKINLYYNNLDNKDILIGYGLPFIDSEGQTNKKLGKGENFVGGYQWVNGSHVSFIHTKNYHKHVEFGELLPNNKEINIKLGIVDYSGKEHFSDNFKIKIVK